MSGLALRRLRAAPGTAVAVTAVLALVATVIALALTWPTALLDDVVRRDLAARPAAERAVQLTLRRPDAVPAARAALTQALGHLGTGPEPVVWQRLRSETRDGPRGVQVVPWAAGDLPEHADLTGGRWAAAAAEATLAETAARALGVGVGGTLAIGDRAVRVVGTWRPREPDDAYWVGADPGSPALLAVAPGQTAGAATTWTTRLVTVPAISTQGQADRVVAGLTGLPTALGALPGPTATLDDTLGPALRAELDRVRLAEVAHRRVLALLLALALAAPVVAGRVFAQPLVREAVTVRARGVAAARQAGQLGAVLGAPALVAAAVAAALSWGTARAAGWPGVATRAAAVAPAVAGVAAALAWVVLVALVIAGSRPGRSRQVWSVAVPLASAAVAAGAAWQVSGAGTRDDLVVAAAGPALLGALAAVVVALLTRLAAVASAVLARSRGVVGALAGWQAARGTARRPGPWALLAAGAALAGCLTAAGPALRRGTVDEVARSLGGRVAVTVPQRPGEGSAPTAPDAGQRLTLGTRLPGTPVTGRTARLGDRDVAVLAVDATRVDAVTGLDLHGADLVQQRPTLVDPQPGSAVDLAATVHPDAEAGWPTGVTGQPRIAAYALVAGPDGAPIRLAMGELAVRTELGMVVGELPVWKVTTSRARLALPPLPAGTTLAGLQLVVDTVPLARLDVRLTAPGSWNLLGNDRSAGAVVGKGSGTGGFTVEVSSTAANVTLTAGPSKPLVSQVVPVLADEAGAALLAGTASPALQFDGLNVPVRVVRRATLPSPATTDTGLATLGGSAPTLLVDAATLASVELAAGRRPRVPTTWWLPAETDAAAARDAVRSLWPGADGATPATVRVRSEVAAVELRRPLLTRFADLTRWAAIAAMVLTVVTALLAQAREAPARRRELAALEALGATSRQLGRLTLARAAVVPIALTCGVAVGLAALPVLVPALISPLRAALGAGGAPSGPAGAAWAALLAVPLIVLPVAAWIDARRAGRGAPSEVLREGEP